ncbi:MAG: cytidine deaminase [Clostridia bacterium]
MNSIDLLKIAENARKNSLCKCSSYSVGAALLAKSGTVYIGANIEDPVIMGLSNCAERVAFQNAFSHGERNFEAIAIVGANKDENAKLDVIPCGMCIQYILDMCDDISIITYDKNGEVKSNKVDYYIKGTFKI